MANCTLSLTSDCWPARNRLGRATASPAMTAMPVTTRRPPANPAMTVATPRVMRNGRAGEAGGLHHGHAQGDLEEQGGGGLPPALLAPDGAQGAPQGVADEHAAGHRGRARPAVLDQAEAERQGQRHPAHGAEDAAELGHVFGRGGPQVPPPEGRTPGAGRGGRHLVGKWFEHHCGRFPLVRSAVRLSGSWFAKEATPIS